MKNRRSVDPVVAVLMTVVLCVVTWAFTSQHYIGEVNAVRPYWEISYQESRPFWQKFGTDKYSRNIEELLIRDFFQGKRDGVFLDVGANHYSDDSNTYFLEKNLGWRGVAVEPLAEFAAEYAQYRPRTIFVPAFAGDRDHGVVAFYVPATARKIMASSQPDYASREQPTEERSVPTATLTTILEQAGIERLDFMSMDIELAEPIALKGLDLARFRPTLVCIESLPEVRQQILEHFNEAGYQLVGKYLRADTHNLYFALGDIPDDPTTRVNGAFRDYHPLR